MKNGHFSSITAHLNTGSQHIRPTEENSCSLFSHQLTNAQMLHSDIRNWGKNILLLQKKHMMTKLSGCHTGSCAGGGKHWCTWPVSFWKPWSLSELHELEWQDFISYTIFTGGGGGREREIRERFVKSQKPFSHMKMVKSWSRKLPTNYYKFLHFFHNLHWNKFRRGKKN